MWLKNYAEQYRRILNLATPVVLAQVGQITVQLADNIMVGRLGAEPLAAVSFANSLFYILFAMGIGVGIGLTPLIGEAYARSEYRRSAAYLQNSVFLFLLVGMAIFAFQFALIPFMERMGQPDEVVRLAKPYYKYIVWSIYPFMLYAAFKQFLEGVGNTRAAMTIVILCNVVNVGLNYIFIYGRLGAEPMGAAGAGLASLIARLLMPVMMILYFVTHNSFRRYLSFFKMSNFGLKHNKTLLSMGIPISMQMGMECAAFALSSIMVGWIGAVELAANQIAMSAANFAFLVLVGVGASTTILVSHRYGARSLRGIVLATNASLHIALAYNIAMALLFVLLRHRIPLIFTSDPAVAAVAARLLLFVGAFQVCDGVQLMCIGALRGLQDVGYATRIAFFAYIVVTLPACYLLTFTLGMGVPGVWLGFAVGLGIAAAMFYTRFRRRVAGRELFRPPARGQCT